MEKKLLRLASRIKEKFKVPELHGNNVKSRINNLNEQLNGALKGQGPRLNNAVGAFDMSEVGKLATKPRGSVRYSNRQKEFTWCPTHVWHAKRFHMMKRWGYQIPFSPNQKCFRSTSRAAKQATLAYDTSYYGLVVVEAGSKENIIDFITTFTKYNDVPSWLVAGTKAYNGWFYIDSEKRALGSAVTDLTANSIMVRLHPAVYADIFKAVVVWAEKRDSAIRVIDCRFAIGSISLYGPTALQSLAKVLHLEGKRPLCDSWALVSKAVDSGLYSPGTTFAVFAKDPRFWKHPVKPPAGKGNPAHFVQKGDTAIDPVARSLLFSKQGRTDSYENMWSLKRLGKEFAARDPSSPKVAGSSKFPLVIHKLANLEWCVSVPWFWVQPLFSMLRQVTGLKVAGSRQQHQVNFERGIPTFPHDYPFTKEGYEHNLMELAAIEAKRAKLPRAKKAPIRCEEYLAPGADWYFLQKLTFGKHFVANKPSKPFGEFHENTDRQLDTLRDLQLVIESNRALAGKPVLTPFTKLNEVHRLFAEGLFVPSKEKYIELPVIQVKLEVSGKGAVKDNARVYWCDLSISLENHIEHLVGFVTSGAFNFLHGGPTAVATVSARCRTESKLYVRNIGCSTFMAAKVLFGVH